MDFNEVLGYKTLSYINIKWGKVLKDKIIILNIIQSTFRTLHIPKQDFFKPKTSSKSMKISAILPYAAKIVKYHGKWTLFPPLLVTFPLPPPLILAGTSLQNNPSCLHFRAFRPAMFRLANDRHQCRPKLLICRISAVKIVYFGQKWPNFDVGLCDINV